jgi:NTE family protein
MHVNLRRIPFFADLPDDALEAIGQRLRKQYYEADAIVFHEGDPGDAMYLVESGQAKVFSIVGGRERVFAFVGPGDFLGELALLLDQPRSASAQMTIDGDLYALYKTDLADLLRDQPTIALQISRELGRRLVATTRRPTRRVEISLIAVEGPVLALAHSLQQQGDRVAIFNLGSALPHDQTQGLMIEDAGESIDDHSLSETCSTLVGKYDRVIVALPYGGGPLINKILALADAVVVIGSGRLPEWAKAARRVWASINDQREIDRIARIIGHRTIGLALSSGGAKGIAHVGVLKVLLEEGVPIDMVAGSSAGSLFGALYCAGWPIDDIIQFALDLRKLIRFRGGLWDPYLPPLFYGLLTGKRTRNFLDRTLKGQAFANLRTPLYVVATDITAGEEVVFDKGSVAEAVRASIGIPGVFVPWKWRNRYLVDGGVVNPVPVSVLIDRGADRIVASSVVRPPGEKPSVPPDVHMPNFIELMTTMMGAMETEILKIRLPQVNVFIHADVERFTALDYHKAKEILAIGEEAARQKLPDIREMLKPAQNA